AHRTQRLPRLLSFTTADGGRRTKKVTTGAFNREFTIHNCSIVFFTGSPPRFWISATLMASRLIHKATYEADNSFDVSLRESFQLLEPQLRPPFSLTIPTQTEYLNLNRAILYGILSETHLAKVHIKHLHGIVIDGYSFFTTLLTRMVNELYTKLVENVKVQLIWVTSEMIYVSAVGVDGLLVALLRQTRGGDFSEANLWLCSELVGLISAKWDCLLDEQPLILSSALYVFLRLLADHCRVSLNSKIEILKQKEIEFCIRVFREQFHLCLKIGRDLIRLLQDLVHVPEFQDIWKDLLLLPANFKTSGFSDISQLYRSRTSSRYFLLRITPEMEAHLRFLLTHVKLGSQTRYQIWFARKFFNVPDSETVIIDIVRFICCAHHPSNKIILSSVIPRWAVIGWLLKCCTKSHVEANVKLALFYDWLFFHEEVDNIMNIEPAILLMINSIPKYVDMTQNLLEFLFLLMDHYDVDKKELIVGCISSVLDVLERRGVVQSFDALISCDMVSPFLKERFLKMLASRNASAFNNSQPAFLSCQRL
ncbi:Integrator complex subunit 3, partial [Cynara cardunculus var. scolymus]